MVSLPQIVEFTNNSFDGPFVYIIYLISLVVSIPLFALNNKATQWIAALVILIIVIIGILVSGRMMVGLFGAGYLGLLIPDIVYPIPIIIGILAILNVVFIGQLIFGQRKDQ